MKKIWASVAVLVAAVGVVYGDIGTSPLYAINQMFLGGAHALAPTAPAILGAISLIFWALTLIVTCKYLIFVLLADHEGQGGVFALLGLLERHRQKIVIGLLLIVLLVSAGLILGEGVMTPAISVLSAVEGLAIANHVFAPFIVIITLAILCVLFAVQYKGTHRLGRIFGPVMLVWFLVIALLGLRQIIGQPGILWALNPILGIQLLVTLHWQTLFFVISGMVLAVSGVEALYADLGHFSAAPLRRGWLFFVYPALILSYFGQGAFLLAHTAPGALAGVTSIFYASVPIAFLYPMIILATVATVVASQALISGAYSLVAQATALNYLPRFRIIHTNRTHEGQIYLPAVNWFLFLGSALLVVVFGSSTALASAYGFAIALVMAATTVAMAAVAILWWQWPWWRSVLVFGCFGAIDVAFVIFTGVRFGAGGWVPVAVGAAIFALMGSWNWARGTIASALTRYARDNKNTMAELVALKKRLATGQGVVDDERGRFVEADRAVVFLVPESVDSLADPVPLIVRAYMRRNGAIAKHVILMHLARSRHAFVRKGRYEIIPFGANIWSVTGRFGFMEEMCLGDIVAELVNDIPVLKHDRFLVEAGTEEVHTARGVAWFDNLRLRLFRLLQRISTPTYRYFGIESSTSLSTTTFHIYIDERGASMRLPDIDLP